MVGEGADARFGSPFGRGAYVKFRSSKTRKDKKSKAIFKRKRQHGYQVRRCQPPSISRSLNFDSITCLTFSQLIQASNRNEPMAKPEKRTRNFRNGPRQAPSKRLGREKVSVASKSVAGNIIKCASAVHPLPPRPQDVGIGRDSNPLSPCARVPWLSTFRHRRVSVVDTPPPSSPRKPSTNVSKIRLHSEAGFFLWTRNSSLLRQHWELIRRHL